MATYNQVESAFKELLKHSKDGFRLALADILEEQAKPGMMDERSIAVIAGIRGLVKGDISENEFAKIYDSSDFATYYAYDPSATYYVYDSSASAAAALVASAAYNAYSAYAAFTAAFAASTTTTTAYAYYSDTTIDKLRDRQLEIIAKYAKEKPSKK